MDAKKISQVEALCRCPRTGLPLRYDSSRNAFVAGDRRYPVVDGIVDFINDAPFTEADVRKPAFDYWAENTPTWFDFTPGMTDDDLRAAFRKNEEITDRLHPYLRLNPPIGSGNEAFRHDRVTGQDFLEVGVGQGQNFSRYVSMGPSVAVGMDFSMKSLQMTARRLAMMGLDALLIRADATEMPFRDGAFGFVFSCGVLHHIPQIDKACSEVGRVTKPGGTCLLMVYNRRSVWYAWDIVVMNGLRALVINKLPRRLVRALAGRDLSAHPMNFPDRRVSLRRVANASTEIGGWKNPLSMFLTPARIRALFGRRFSYRFFTRETASFSRLRVRYADRFGWGCFLWAELKG